MSRLPVQNGGEDLVCLFIEPYGEDFWLMPGNESAVVPAEDASDPQFTVVAAKGRLVVWIFEGGDPAKIIVDYTVIGSNGTELECGYQWSADQEPAWHPAHQISNGLGDEGGVDA